jgi:hypothetical protein
MYNGGMKMIFRVVFDNDYDKNTDCHSLLSEISKELHRHKITLSLTDEELIGIEFAREYVLKNGIDTLLNLNNSISTEDVHGKISDIDAKVGVFHEQFKALDFPTECKSLKIYDPYILPKKYDPDYECLFLKIIGYFQNIEDLTFITSINYNISLYNNIKNNIKNKISIKTTDDIHDRFWIINDSKGILIGTSLNGFGKKYTVMNPLREDDVQDILKIL